MSRRKAIAIYCLFLVIFGCCGERLTRHEEKKSKWMPKITEEAVQNALDSKTIPFSEGMCLRQNIVGLNEVCEEMSFDAQVELSIKLTNCFFELMGRPPIDCVNLRNDNPANFQAPSSFADCSREITGDHWVTFNMFYGQVIQICQYLTLSNSHEMVRDALRNLRWSVSQSHELLEVQVVQSQKIQEVALSFEELMNQTLGKVSGQTEELQKGMKELKETQENLDLGIYKLLRSAESQESLFKRINEDNQATTTRTMEVLDKMKKEEFSPNSGFYFGGIAASFFSNREFQDNWKGILIIWAILAASLENFLSTLPLEKCTETFFLMFILPRSLFFVGLYGLNERTYRRLRKWTSFEEEVEEVKKLKEKVEWRLATPFMKEMFKKAMKSAKKGFK